MIALQGEQGGSMDSYREGYHEGFAQGMNAERINFAKDMRTAGGVIVTEKKWFESKTIRVNIVMFLIAVLAMSTQYVPEAWHKGILFGSAILNIGLRFMTGQPIDMPKKI